MEAVSDPVDPALAERWMRRALELAAEAWRLGETPIGAVIADLTSGQIIAEGFNRRGIDHDPTAHAEMVALRAAGAATGHWRLTDRAMIVTLEPCPMCAGALVNARVPLLIYGADDPKAGAARSLFGLCDDPRLNHRMEIVAGVLADESAELLRGFFRAQRAMGKK